MEKAEISRVRRDPLFQTLVRRRRRFVLCLTAATIVPYYAFVLVAAFSPDILAAKFHSGGAMNIAWPIGAALIVATWILTGIYMRRANTVFDELTTRVMAGARK